jgi:hypothetical protein
MTAEAGILYPRPGEPIVRGLTWLHVSRSSKNSLTGQHGERFTDKLT